MIYICIISFYKILKFFPDLKDLKILTIKL